MNLRDAFWDREVLSASSFSSGGVFESRSQPYSIDVERPSGLVRLRAILDRLIIMYAHICRSSIETLNHASTCRSFVCNSLQLAAFL